MGFSFALAVAGYEEWVRLVVKQEKGHARVPLTCPLAASQSMMQILPCTPTSRDKPTS